MKRTFFIDVQFMQTGAYQRGMGRYLVGLLKEMLSRDLDAAYTCIYSRNLPSENIGSLQKELSSTKHADSVEFVELDLKIHTFQRNQYRDAYHWNLREVDSFMSGREVQGLVYWFIPSLMQEPAVPVFPTGDTALKMILWHDLMPYLMDKHYFPDQESAHAQSYAARLNILPYADLLLANSITTKNDLVRYLSIPAEKIAIINGSLNQALLEPVGELPESITKPFLLCIASAEPNKNAVKTVNAFVEFNESKNNKYQLVIITKLTPEIQDSLKTIPPDVMFAGYLDVSQLARLYKECQALLFASTYEGLGMPLVEAVTFGKKVVCSDIPVFREITATDAFYWCDPHDVTSIVASLDECLKTPKLSSLQHAEYEKIKTKYSWKQSTDDFMEALPHIISTPAPQKTVALVGPHPSSFSSIGKFVAETYPHTVKYAQVHYYYDSGPSDKRHGFIRFSYLSEYEHLYPIEELPSRIDQYDTIVYHMGNSDHHMKSYLLAHANPGTLVLHDTNLGGDGLAAQMQSNGLLSRERVNLEKIIEKEFLGQDERFITSLVSSQPETIVHSTFAGDIVKKYNLHANKSVTRANHPMHILDAITERKKSGPLQLGIAGIMSEVKGVNSIDWLMSETDRLKGCQLTLFGFGFFTDRGALLELMQKYPNVKVQFDLSDLEFQDLLSSMDVLINYRPVYKGEASRATLEAMRAKVVPVVRDIGWFSELPDDTCFKIKELSELPHIIKTLVDEPAKAQDILDAKSEKAYKLLAEKFGFDEYVKTTLRIKT